MDVPTFNKEKEQIIASPVLIRDFLEDEKTVWENHIYEDEENKEVASQFLHKQIHIVASKKLKSKN